MEYHFTYLDCEFFAQNLPIYRKNKLDREIGRIFADMIHREKVHFCNFAYEHILGGNDKLCLNLEKRKLLQMGQIPSRSLYFSTPIVYRHNMTYIWTV